MFDDYEEDDQIQKSLDDSLAKEELRDGESEHDSNDEIESDLYRPSKQDSGDTKLKGKGRLKKFGPFGFLLAILTGSTVGLSTLMTPALAINHFGTALDDMLNTQSQVTKTRMDKLTTSKWTKHSSNLTSSRNKFLKGRVDRFNKISPKYQARLEKNGFKLEFDGGGKRVTSITYEGKTFNNATDFNTHYNSDANLRRATDQSKKGIFGTMVDKWTLRLKTKLKLLSTNLLVKIKNLAKRFTRRRTDSISKEGVANLQDDIISGKPSNKINNLKPDPRADGVDTDSIKEVNALGKQDRKSSQQSIKSESAFSRRLTKSFNVLTAVGGFSNRVCGIYYNAITSNMFAKMQNAIQLIRFALSFMSVADAIKAGDATEEAIALIGNNLLSMIPDSSGIARTAMSSAGFLWSSQAKMPSNIDSALAFANASVGAIAEFFATIKKYEGTINTICKVSDIIADPLSKIGVSQTAQLVGTVLVSLASVATSVAAGASTGGPAGAIIGLLTAIGKMALRALPGWILSKAMSNIAETISGNYQGAVTGLTVSSKTMGIDMGEAISSGLSAYHSKLNASTGAGVVTVDDALQSAAAQRVFIARRAADERAIRSPFDASSPYTFLGSIIYKAWPQRSSTGGLVGSVKTIFGLAKTFVSETLPSSQAMAYAADKKAFTSCPDPDYKSIDINGKRAAFDMYCNPVHTIPISAQYTAEEAMQVGIYDIGTMVADNTEGGATNWVGEYFTPNMVNYFIDSDPNAEDSKRAWLNDSGINESDNNLLWQYYKNCKLRADNNVPYGAMFNQDASEESTGIGEALYGGEKENEWGSGPLSQGDECYIDGQNLIKNSMPPAPSENASEGEVRSFMKSNLDNYTDFGKKLMFMLFLRDERAQCILDGEENCQELWNKKTLTYSAYGYGGQARVWPLASSTNVTQKFGNGSKGIMIAGKAGEDVLAVMDGNVDRVTVESDGSYSVVIKSVDGSREDFYSNLEIVSVIVTDSVYSGQVIGKLRGSGVSDAPVRADKDGWVVKYTEVSLTIKHDGQAGRANYGNLTNIPEKFKDASQTNMIPVAEGEIIGYAKSSVHLDFKIKMNGEYINPMNLLNPYSSSGGSSVKIAIGELDKYTTGPSKDYIISVLNAIAQNRVFQSAHRKVCFVSLSQPYVEGLTAEECRSKGRQSSPYGSRCLQFANHHAGILAGGADPGNMTAQKGAGSESYGKLEKDPGLNYPISDGNSKQRVLNKIFQKISDGQVCVLKVGGTNVSNSTPPRHFVTVVGFKNSVTSANQLKESDLLTIDSWDGRLKPLGISNARYMFHEKGSWWVRCTE